MSPMASLLTTCVIKAIHAVTAHVDQSRVIELTGPPDFRSWLTFPIGSSARPLWVAICSA